MTWIVALLARKQRLEYELALVEELEALAGDMDWEEKDEEQEPEVENPAPQAEDTPPPKATRSRKPEARRTEQGSTAKAIVQIMEEALAKGISTMTPTEIGAALATRGIVWKDASANMGSLLRTKDCPVERAGRGVYRLKAQPESDQSPRVRQVEQIMLDSGMHEMDPEMIYERLRKLDPKAHWEDPDLNMHALSKCKGGDIFQRTPRGTWCLKPDPLRRRGARMLGGGGTLCNDRGTVTGSDDAGDDD